MLDSIDERASCLPISFRLRRYFCRRAALAGTAPGATILQKFELPMQGSPLLRCAALVALSGVCTANSLPAGRLDHRSFSGHPEWQRRTRKLVAVCVRARVTVCGCVCRPVPSPTHYFLIQNSSVFAANRPQSCSCRSIARPRALRCASLFLRLYVFLCLCVSLSLSSSVSVSLCVSLCLSLRALASHVSPPEQDQPHGLRS